MSCLQGINNSQQRIAKQLLTKPLLIQKMPPPHAILVQYNTAASVLTLIHLALKSNQRTDKILRALRHTHNS